jgi:hypothetical protein
MGSFGYTEEWERVRTSTLVYLTIRRRYSSTEMFGGVREWNRVSDSLGTRELEHRAYPCSRTGTVEYDRCAPSTCRTYGLGQRVQVPNGWTRPSRDALMSWTRWSISTSTKSVGSTMRSAIHHRKRAGSRRRCGRCALDLISPAPRDHPQKTCCRRRRLLPALAWALLRACVRFWEAEEVGRAARIVSALRYDAKRDSGVSARDVEAWRSLSHHNHW